MELGAYEVLTAKTDYSEPDWPKIAFQKILETAFKDNFITDINHPVIKKLKGEI